MTAVLHQFPDSADMVMFMIGPGLYSRVMRPRLVTTALYLARAAGVCCPALSYIAATISMSPLILPPHNYANMARANKLRLDRKERNRSSNKFGGLG